MAAPQSQVLALKITAFDLSARATVEGPPFPGGESDIDDPQTFGVAGTEVETWVATLGRSTSADDEPANTWIPGRLSADLNFSSSLFGGVDPLGGATTALSQGGATITLGGATVLQGSSALSPRSSTIGEFVLLDPERELDVLLKQSLDGATLELYRGSRTDRIADFERVGKFTAAGWGEVDARTKRIKLKDLSWLLAAADLHGRRYTGGGGIDGDARLANRIKPWALGTVARITPVTLVSALLIHQVSCTAVRSITNVQEGGNAAIPLDTGVGTAGDCADYATLAAASITSGKYATCLALGLFRLGSAPTLQITCNVEGDNETIGGVGYVSTRAAIARRIAIGRGNLAFAIDDLDAASFAALEDACPDDCGWYFDQEMTKGQALDVVMEGISGWWNVTIGGLLQLDYDREPSSTPDYTVTCGPDAGIDGVPALGSPVLQTQGSPRQATYLLYARNHTMQTPDQLAAGIAGSDEAARYGEPGLLASDTDSLLARAWPTAPIVSAESGLALLAPAQAEASRQQRLRRTARQRVRLPVDADPFEPVQGKTVRVAGWEGVGMAGDWYARCVGFDVVNGQVAWQLIG